MSNYLAALASNDSSQGAIGQRTVPDVFLLTDEQILEILPEPASAGRPQDVEIAEEAAPAPLPGSPEQSANLPSSTADAAAQPSATGNPTAAPAPFSNPEDVRAVAELYPGGLTQAKTAAERARLLDDIDRAYFGAAGGTPEQARASRAELAQVMLREDPAAFREMVFAGLRALQESNVAPPFRAASARIDANRGPATAQPNAPGNDAGLKPGATQAPDDPHLAVYAEFEKAANADLEKSVGSAIERALHQALPNLSSSEQGASVGARFSASPAPLQARLSQAIREDVEKALQGDRQLGEQVVQILSGRRFNQETRAQVVRLINDRAQQLVPGAAKRALHDWTQATLAAHRARTERGDAASSRREVATAATASRDVHATQSVAHPFRGEDSSARHSAQNSRSDTRPSAKSRFDYRRLSDEQILDL